MIRYRTELIQQPALTSHLATQFVSHAEFSKARGKACLEQEVRHPAAETPVDAVLFNGEYCAVSHSCPLQCGHIHGMDAGEADDAARHAAL